MPQPAPLTIDQAMDRFDKWAEGYYRKGDRASPELLCLRRPVKVARELFAALPAAAFGLHELKAVREKLIQTPARRPREGENEDVVPRLSRKTVNDHVARVIRVVRWLASEELVPAEIPVQLAAIAALRRGRSPARETRRVRPVPWDVVAKALELLRRPPRAMVELLWWTGARVNEVCSMRRGAPVWWTVIASW